MGLFAQKVFLQIASLKAWIKCVKYPETFIDTVVWLSC